MDDGEFQWDDAKAVRNIVRHRVSFDVARRVFDDLFAVEQIDNRERYGEERFSIIGMAAGRLLHVAYAMNGDAIRIISARAAEPFEHRAYHEQNS